MLAASLVALLLAPAGVWCIATLAQVRELPSLQEREPAPDVA